uniref:Poly [ADP-ribose] polymerase n=1 Tax=Petromyzon marinus TaxID=7757 RepID=A0AAJ7U2P4_PETMA|nr:protein mono-ADP-ribosyltransferase PARP4 isoform X1 [Petromyzon marinus]
MGLFSACFIVLDLPSWPRRQRLQLKEQLTAHGAIISHAVTSHCTHLVVSAEGAGSPSRLKLAAKHGVRVVCPEFLDRCFATGQLLEPALADDPADNNNIAVGNEERENGVVTSAIRTKTRDHKRGPPAEETFELNKVKLWVDDDEDINRPAFPEEFEMVRSAIFCKTSEKEQTKEQYWAVVEVQAAPHSSGLVFRVAAYHATCKNSDKVTSRLTKVRMAGSGREAEVFLGHACEVLTGERCGMVKVDQLPGDLQLGSRMFQQAQTEISMANFHLSKEVGRFVSTVWSEALGHLSQILQVPILLIEPKQVTKAEAILLQLKKAVLSKDVHDEGALERLSNEFYKIIPQKHVAVCPLTGMASISAKLDLCQLIRDVVDANEATRNKNTGGDDSSMRKENLALKKLTASSHSATTLAQFTALRCSLLHLEPNSSDFNSIRNQLLQSSHGRLDGFKILKIFRVDRPAEIGQFRSEVGNTRSLFHAFAPRSLLGILSRGLLLPKTVVGEFGVERTDIGMLGCGIYFSDSISTSVKYARRAAARDGGRVLAVCDVALGRCHLVRRRDRSLAAPPQGHDSLHGARATPGTASEFEDDEFVIYDPRQQKLRYIVQFCLESDVVKEEENSDAEEFYEAPETPADERILPEPNIPELLPEQGEPKQRLSGLHSGVGSPVPLKAVHVRANILDFTAQVVVMQEYDNNSTEPIEAKYTFPLDEMAAVCSFEAFINGKHIVGQVKEKETAHQQYRNAVSQGHGAYLMDQESPDVFVVSVGNLPPACRVLIKVTYVCELAAEGAAVRFRLPGNLAPWQQRLATGDVTQETVETLAVAKHSGRLSVQVSVEMPYEIINVTSPTHAIRVKRTACKAVVELASSDDSLGSEFQLLVFPAQIHEPRMWVEQNPETDSQACILTFYPEFAPSHSEGVDIVLCLDCSASMTTQPLTDVKRLALFALRHLPPGSRFNVLKFGTHYKELFPVFRESSPSNIATAVSFIKRLHADAGNTELWRPLRSVALLAGGVGGSRDAAAPPVSVLLLTDGVAQSEARATREARENVRLLRVLACGVGETPNRYFLNALARNSGGACEFFTAKNRSTWTDKMLALMEKATQPVCRDVTVEWQRFDRGALGGDRVEMQAPRMIRSVFCGTRLVVYGIVPHCTQATLHAIINNQEFSTMVSTSNLQITRGKMLHRLTAHAIIQDYEDGNLHPDETQHEVIIAEMKSRIIELSKEYSIITPYTSFVAVEERDSTLADEATGPALDELLSKESVDFLPYVGWVEEEKARKKKGSMQFHLRAEKTKAPVGGRGGLASSKIKYRKTRPACFSLIPEKTEQTPEIEFGSAAERANLSPFEIEAAADTASQYPSEIQPKFAHASVEAVPCSNEGPLNLSRRDVKDHGVSASRITTMSASSRFGERHLLHRAAPVILKEAFECRRSQQGFGSSAYAPRSVVHQLNSAETPVPLIRAQAFAPLTIFDNVQPPGVSLGVIAMETPSRFTPPYQDTFERGQARRQSDRFTNSAYPFKPQKCLARVKKPPPPLLCFTARSPSSAALMPDVHELRAAGLMSRVPECAKRDVCALQLPNRDSPPTDFPEPPRLPPPPPAQHASRFGQPMHDDFQSSTCQAASRLCEESPFGGSSNLSESFSSEDDYGMPFESCLMFHTSPGVSLCGSSGSSEFSDTTPWQHADLSKITCLQNKDGSWDGGVELSSLVGWSPDHITVILKKQGIQSLGLRMEEAIVRLVWTLLVLQILRLRMGLASSLNEFVLLLLRRDVSTLAELDMFMPGSADAFARAASWIRSTESVCPCVCTRLELGPNWQAATCSLLGVA